MSVLAGGALVVPVMGRASVVLTAVVAVALCLCAVVCLRIGPPAHRELVATCRGRRMVMFASDDEREFGQVCRGIQRAMEQRR